VVETEKTSSVEEEAALETSQSSQTKTCFPPPWTSPKSKKEKGEVAEVL
jgi:hypothetical protein